MAVFRLHTTNAPSGNNQVLTLKAATGVQPDSLGIGLTSITIAYSAAPKGDYWKNSATEGSEYIVEIYKRSKS